MPLPVPGGHRLRGVAVLADDARMVMKSMAEPRDGPGGEPDHARQLGRPRRRPGLSGDLGRRLRHGLCDRARRRREPASQATAPAGPEAVSEHRLPGPRTTAQPGSEAAPRRRFAEGAWLWSIALDEAGRASMADFHPK
ncbi:MAG: hypothetical protein JO224_06630 [Pelomonas sp.]|nr:hypothetical protein [Roseateles sp.]